MNLTSNIKNVGRKNEYWIRKFTIQKNKIEIQCLKLHRVKIKVYGIYKNIVNTEEETRYTQIYTRQLKSVSFVKVNRETITKYRTKVTPVSNMRKIKVRKLQITLNEISVVYWLEPVTKYA